jgi:hypothetical protein
MDKIVFSIGDRVTRKPVNNFDRSGMKGTIVAITPDYRNKIKWDEKQRTGQQHSTIQSKFLIKVKP